MKRSSMARMCAIGLLAGGAVLVALVPASPVAADVPIDSVCTTSTVGTTITLLADCVTTEALTIPDGFTLNGAGLTISAVNPPAPAHTYTGAVVTNAAGATTMNIVNLTITGPAGGFPFTLPAPSCNTPLPGLFGIFFNDASGSVDDVDVVNIFQTNTAPASPACNTGHSIRADGVTAERTVTVTNTRVSNYQKAGLFASGTVTMNVSADTIIGPPSFVPFSIGQNGVQWTSGASGTMTDTTTIGSSFGSTGPVDPASAASTAVLLFGADDITIDSNTITGESDVGISVNASTNVTISFNAIGRSTTPEPDPFGIGVDVDEASQATTRLICNTYSLWQTNIVGEVEEPCPPPPTTTTTTSTTIPAVLPPAPTTTTAAGGQLPSTGPSSDSPVYLGVLALVFGAALVAVTRRRVNDSRPS